MHRIKRVSENLIGRFGFAFTNQELASALAEEASKTQKATAYRNSQSEDEEISLSTLMAFLEEPIELICAPKDSKEREMMEFWARYNRLERPVASFVKKYLDCVDVAHSSDVKACVDLGSGNSGIASQLLEKKWEFHAVDSSMDALVFLAKDIEKKAITNPKLQIHHKKIEEFVFPQNVSLITAQSALPYVDPNCLQNIWDRIHASLKPSGCIAANVFVRPLDERREEGQREGGIWYSNIRMIKALASNKNYQIMYLKEKNFWKPSGASIEFIFRKR